ncbi:MAG: hypothetical protein K2P79_00395 [Sphingomonas sp.]|nr:hypothetical protein [Sphingomonas sp.]
MSDEKQPLVRVKMENKVTDYLHNNVASAAFHFRERLEKAFEDKDRADGIFLDMIGLTTMTAFALEGYVNFVGGRLIERCVKDKDRAAESWQTFERKRTKDKIKAIRKMTGIEIDWNKRPYPTVGELNDLRNMFAHPKPHKPKVEEWEAVGTNDEFKRQLRNYKPEYAERLTWEFAQRAHDDVEQIWQELLAGAGINPYETLSGGSQGFSLLTRVNEDGSETSA